MTQPHRRMPLAQAAVHGPQAPAIYTLLRARMQSDAWSIRSLRCGQISDYAVSFVPTASNHPHRLQLEGRHMGRVARILRRRGQPDLTNINREARW